MFKSVDPRTPVLIGVGQFTERLEDDDYKGLSPAELCVQATNQALRDSGVDTRALAACIDTIAATRQVENSTPMSRAPLGMSNNLPRSVAHRIGADPQRAILETVGGNSPQHLINEFARNIALGGADVVLLVGAEAISTQRHFLQQAQRPSFAEDVPGTLEDRGYGLSGLVSRYASEHGLHAAPEMYAVLENARRARLGQSIEAYRRQVGTLFASFSRKASANPYSATHHERSALELATPSEQNRPIADPYLRHIVARDQVNQAAAVILTSAGKAMELGVRQDRWVYLNGHADMVERALLDRQDLGKFPAAGASINEALRVAGITLADVSAFDLYSCFPIAVCATCDAIGLEPDDPRELTLTGGLPFFGGPGNNYSMHGVAEAVTRARNNHGQYVLVGANGGILSKYSTGIYSTVPPAAAWVADDCPRLQAELDSVPPPVVVMKPNGWGTLESYTVIHGKDHKRTGVVIGRLERDGRRFIANSDPNDPDMQALLDAGMPFGQRIFVRALAIGNRVALQPDVLAALYPAESPVLKQHYEFLNVRRDGHVLEITINRSEVRNSLHPPAHDELDHVFNAFFADPQLWVAILTGAGDKAFCAGNDLLYTSSGQPMWIPTSGFGGITARGNMTKPIICAVNGFAMGGGFEMALACHLIVADETSRFALSEPKVGLVAGAGGLIRLPRQVPLKTAYELILTGRQASAGEAHALGLVNRVAAVGKVMEVARELAAEIVENSPTSIRLSMQLMNETLGVPDTLDALEQPTKALDDLMASQDAWEGLAAFAQKRKPVWRNR